MRGNNISLSDFVENIVYYQPKEGEKMGKLYEYNGIMPTISESAYIYDSAEITTNKHELRMSGHIGRHLSVGFGPSLASSLFHLFHLQQTSSQRRILSGIS